MLIHHCPSVLRFALAFALVKVKLVSQKCFKIFNNSQGGYPKCIGYAVFTFKYKLNKNSLYFF